MRPMIICFSLLTFGAFGSSDVRPNNSTILHLGSIRKLTVEASDNNYLGPNGEQVVAAIKRIKPDQPVSPWSSYSSRNGFRIINIGM